MLSEALWTREFGRDPNIVGKQIKLDGTTYAVIGVISTGGFPTYWRQIDAFTSLGRLEHAIGGPSNRALHIGVSAYARLKPGVSVEQARNEMTAIAQRLEKQYPQTNAGQGVIVQRLMEREVGTVSRPLQLLMAAVFLVLLIACVNVANLLTSRAIVRQREIAIRSALGAGLGRLIAQLLCESTLLAMAGGVLGLLAAYCAIFVLGHRAAAILPRSETIAIDGRVLLFTATISLITGLIFGVIPALAAYRSHPMEALQENGRSPRYGLWRVRVRSVLAIVELAVALVLLVAAGLTLKSLFRITRTDLGIQADGVMTAVLNFPAIPYKAEAELDAVTRKLIPRVLALPHVTAAGFESAQLVGGSEVTFRVEGDAASAGDQEPYAAFSSVTPGTLEALGARLIGGRLFAWSDGANTQPVCIIDDSMAARYWPGESAIGKKLTTDVPTTPDGKPIGRTVVGVVHRVTINAADEQHLVEIFIPYSQYQILRRGRLVIRSDADPSALIAGVRRVVHSINPDLPLYDMRSLSELVDENVAARRLEVLLLSLFAAIALVLAALGVYGVMAYMVNGRMREIGLRLALGAKPGDILQLILSQAMPLILTGAAAGVFASLFLKRALSTVLFGVSPTDPSTIAAVAGILVIVALVPAACPCDTPCASTRFTCCGGSRKPAQILTTSE